jgi:acyl-CoA synthetase (AMP-forming)/AMP-acid ligase II
MSAAVLWQRIEQAFLEHRSRNAVADHKRQLTYGELSMAVAGVAEDVLHAFSHVRSGPLRVAVYAHNSLSWAVAFLGLLRAGAVPFLFDPEWGAVETVAAVEGCGIDLVLHDQPLPRLKASTRNGSVGELSASLTSPDYAERPDLHPDTELCRFTTGTTGFPNCIEFSGAAVRNAGDTWRIATGLGSEDRILCFAGLSNGLAFNTSLVPALLAGSLLKLPGGLPSGGQVARLLAGTNPTRLTGFPALYASLLRRSAPVEGLDMLRVALSSGAPLPMRHATALLDRYGLRIANYYAIAETGPLTYDPTPLPDRGQGYPLPGAELLLDGGTAEAPVEILARSASIGTRYLNAPGVLEAKLTGDGFYHSGDEGFLHEGRLYLSGRAGKEVNVFGRKVDPREVIQVLRELAEVSDAAVLAFTRRSGDPALGAVVVAEPTASADSLRDHCRGRLAAYKIPERILIVDRLPASSIGKPRFEALRALLEGRDQSGLA